MSRRLARHAAQSVRSGHAALYEKSPSLSGAADQTPATAPKIPELRERRPEEQRYTVTWEGEHTL